MTYAAPLADIRFLLAAVIDADAIARLYPETELDGAVLDAILEEAGRFAAEALAPLNPTGDRVGCAFENGFVRTPPGWADAYRRFVDGGWVGVGLPREGGGQGLPCVVATALADIWTQANMAFAIAPMLTRAAAELLAAHGDDALKGRYLAPLTSGAWTGTMDLTEPQAGSDLGLATTRATPHGDAWRLFGQKIFITYGEHDLAPNIVHFVLARTPGAPPGARGLSLFLAPKRLVGPDGAPGEANDIRCIAIERKMGIHGSPTTALKFGERGGATAFLLGEERRGLDQMFTMMNRARLEVGLQGAGIAERAYQQARSYAFERLQGRPFGDPGPGPAPIARHPDVQRMLLGMRAATEAARALGYFVAAEIDRAARGSGAEERAHARETADLLTPVAKAWLTDVGVAVTSAAIQVHGGVGYIEDSGVPQHYRDARIAAIYEGTNGIQALDLVARKLARDRGAAMARLIARMRALDAAFGDQPPARLAVIRARLMAALDDLEAATAWTVSTMESRPQAAAAGACAYLELTAVTVAGWLMATAALAALRRGRSEGADRAFLAAKIRAAHAFAEFEMARSATLRAQSAAVGEVLDGIDPAADL